LPELVQLGDLRGDLHSHSTWSADGKNTIEEMAQACIAKSYRYLVVTDHSHYLREGKLEAQWKEIEGLNERLAPFQILKGIEVNIRSDGSLDMPDELLAACDWVVASVHSSLGSDVTERIVSAMESPHVDSIGHPTGRKINRRGPSDLDFERVVETALGTGTFLEIDSQPDRLDLRDAHARAAAEAGLKIAITSDAHQISALDYVEIGIGQARRAWLTKEQVLNTRTWPQLKKLRKK
jgi:DNA polymerase (family 10)